MMLRRRRPTGVVLAGLAMLALSQAAPARGQGEGRATRGPDEGPKSVEPAESRAEMGLVPSLRASATLNRKLEAARSYLRTKSWNEAIGALQALLDRTEDALVAVKRAGEDGETVTHWTGIRGEAARLLAALPASGRECYDATCGPRAKALLAEARKKGDMSLVAEVARRYPHTDPGAEAIAFLGAYHLDRAHYALAALCFERVMRRQQADEFPPAMLFHAALAFRGAGDRARAEQLWKRMTAVAPAGLRLRGTAFSLVGLKAELDPTEIPGPARPAFALEGAPILEPRWTRPTAHEDTTRTVLEAAVREQEARAQPVLPAASPVVANGRIVYRSHRGLHAVDARTGREAWQSSSAWSIDQMMPQPRYSSSLQSWVSDYLEYSPHVLFGNAILGTLSTDGARIYAVDDLAVPPYRRAVRSRFRQEMTQPDFGPELTDAAYASRLLALNAASGKVIWEVGGRAKVEEAGRLSDSYFLGPALPLDGRLFALTEKDNEVALVCLRPADGSLVWKQALAYAPTRLFFDPGRRVQAACPTYGGGMLVCPTNAGMVVGVDLLTRGLAWAYSYRTKPLTQSQSSGVRRGRASPTQVAAEWQAPVTIVHRGRVLFTAPDGASIHCLSLRDGSLLWQGTRGGDDLYVAGVFADRVLVVGKKACRALDLDDGKQLWRVETGLPSGRGVGSDNLYYLPLHGSVEKKEPAVCAIDMRKGVIRARTPSPRKEVVGNLLLWQGGLFTQTVTAVTAYPERKEGDSR